MIIKCKRTIYKTNGFVNDLLPPVLDLNRKKKMITDERFFSLPIPRDPSK